MPSRASAALCGKNAPAISTKIGSLPAQDMNGMMAMVIIRLFLLSIARVAIIAGTLQPKPITIGMNDLPCRPILCISLSTMNAALDMYPESSIREMKK